MRNKAFSLFLAVMAVATLASTAASAADMFTGKWKLRPAKVVRGGVTAGSSTEVITLLPNGIRIVTDSAASDGGKNHFEFTAQFDGKDYPFKQTLDGKLVSDRYDTVAVRTLDDYTLEVLRKRDGGLEMLIRTVVSKDGKTFASTVTGLSPDGQPFTNTATYVKQ